MSNISKSCPNPDCENTELYTDDELIDICPSCKGQLVELDLTQEDLESEEEEEEDDEEDWDDTGSRYNDLDTD